MAPQAIGGEEKLMLNEVKHFHSGQLWFLVINDLGDIRNFRKELLNLDLKLSLSAQIELIMTDNSSTCPICQLSSYGTDFQFKLWILLHVVNVRIIIKEY